MTSGTASSCASELCPMFDDNFLWPRGISHVPGVCSLSQKCVLRLIIMPYVLEVHSIFHGAFFDPRGESCVQDVCPVSHKYILCLISVVSYRWVFCVT